MNATTSLVWMEDISSADCSFPAGVAIPVPTAGAGATKVSSSIVTSEVALKVAASGDSSLGKREYHCLSSGEGTKALPMSSILLRIDLIESRTVVFSVGWWRMSSSIAVPTRTAFSLSASNLMCRGEVKIDMRPGMMVGRVLSWRRPSWFRQSAPRALGTAWMTWTPMFKREFHGMHKRRTSIMGSKPASMAR
jgi:hypothetical protein